MHTLPCCHMWATRLQSDSTRSSFPFRKWLMKIEIKITLYGLDNVNVRHLLFCSFRTLFAPSTLLFHPPFFTHSSSLGRVLCPFLAFSLLPIETPTSRMKPNTKRCAKRFFIHSILESGIRMSHVSYQFQSIDEHPIVVALLWNLKLKCAIFLSDPSWISWIFCVVFSFIRQFLSHSSTFSPLNIQLFWQALLFFANVQYNIEYLSR